MCQSVLIQLQLGKELNLCKEIIKVVKILNALSLFSFLISIHLHQPYFSTMEQREQPGLPSRTLSDNGRVLRVLHFFNAFVENAQFLLDAVYYRFFNCSPSYFLSPETLLINRRDIVFLNMTKINLLNRLRLHYPGEQYVLLQLVNMVTVARYQFELILEATFRGCRDTFFQLGRRIPSLSALYRPAQSSADHSTNSIRI